MWVSCPYLEESLVYHDILVIWNLEIFYSFLFLHVLDLTKMLSNGRKEEWVISKFSITKPKTHFVYFFGEIKCTRLLAIITFHKIKNSNQCKGKSTFEKSLTILIWNLAKNSMVLVNKFRLHFINRLQIFCPERDPCLLWHTLEIYCLCNLTC